MGPNGPALAGVPVRLTREPQPGRLTREPQLRNDRIAGDLRSTGHLPDVQRSADNASSANTEVPRRIRTGCGRRQMRSLRGWADRAGATNVRSVRSVIRRVPAICFRSSIFGGKRCHLRRSTVRGWRCASQGSCSANATGVVVISPGSLASNLLRLLFRSSSLLPVLSEAMRVVTRNSQAEVSPT